MKSGKRLPGDEDGLSIGFKELETMEEFKERTQKGLTICGIVQVGANIVHGLDLTITSLSDDPLHGNIVGMPYDQSTPEMTPEQMAEVNPAKAYNLQTELAKKSKIMARW